ncbi:MAG: DEAD/DEAH box helicase [Comamonadaceae bacterium]|nr:DEAD/DEAH box helicase [Comamonadaceae bacterium]
MDRLVCGDVGFGKTEVALRAAFVAVADGKQVAVLVPTTLLAEQHFQTFSDRFAALAGEARRAVALPQRQGDRPPRSQGLADGTHRHRHRHPPADPEGRQVQAPRPGDHRRGAPLRRAPEGTAEGAARRGGRADPHRHADPAHAGDVAGGPARLLGDRHRAAEAPRRSRPSSRAIRPGIDPRGGAARAEARRPGLLPAQRGRHHREPCASGWRSCCRRRASRVGPRPDGASASWST